MQEQDKGCMILSHSSSFTDGGNKLVVIVSQPVRTDHHKEGLETYHRWASPQWM